MLTRNTKMKHDLLYPRRNNDIMLGKSKSIKNTNTFEEKILYAYHIYIHICIYENNRADGVK